MKAYITLLGKDEPILIDNVVAVDLVPNPEGEVINGGGFSYIQRTGKTVIYAREGRPVVEWEITQLPDGAPALYLNESVQLILHEDIQITEGVPTVSLKGIGDINNRTE